MLALSCREKVFFSLSIFLRLAPYRGAPRGVTLYTVDDVLAFQMLNFALPMFLLYPECLFDKGAPYEKRGPFMRIGVPFRAKRRPVRV